MIPQIVDVICNSDRITLNINTPIRVQTPHYNKHHHHTSPHCLTHCSTEHHGQLNTRYHQTTYLSSPQLTYDMTTHYYKTDGLSPTTRKLTVHNSRKIQSPFSLRPPYPRHTHCQQIYLHTNIILMADKRNIPNGKMHSNCMLLPDHRVCKTIRTNNVMTANTCDPALKLLNEEMTSDIQNINKTYGRNS